MPSDKPRVAVRVEPRVYEVLVRLAQLTGRSRGAFVSELLDEMYPSLCRTVALLDAARDAPEQIKRGIAAAVEGVEADIRASGDMFSEASFSALEDAVREGSTPVSVTRGSGAENQEVTGGQEGGS